MRDMQKKKICISLCARTPDYDGAVGACDGDGGGGGENFDKPVGLSFFSPSFFKNLTLCALRRDCKFVLSLRHRRTVEFGDDTMTSKST